MKIITLTSTAILLMTIATVTSAQIYKWVDANGQQHYTQRPAPVGHKAESIEDKIRFAAALGAKKRSSKGSSYMPPSPRKHLTEKKETPLREEIATKQKKAEDNYREQLDNYCTSQRENIKQLQSSNPIAWEENGKTELLTGKDKEKKIAAISESVEKNCSVKKDPESN